MKNYEYKITISDSTGGKNLTFKTTNHDDLFEIFEKMKAKNCFIEDDVYSFSLGLKMFSETMLNYKNFLPFEKLKPAFHVFMKELKSFSPEEK